MTAAQVVLVAVRQVDSFRDRAHEHDRVGADSYSVAFPDHPSSRVTRGSMLSCAQKYCLSAGSSSVQTYLSTLESAISRGSLLYLTFILG